ncbi:MAG: nitroreductase family protein, partial [Thermoanaerobaculum sp.]
QGEVGQRWVWQPRWVATGPSEQGPDLLQLIKNRRSYRRFSPQPPSPGQLPTVLARVGLLVPLLPGGDGVEVRVVVVRDGALSPGVYRWRPDGGGLQLVKSGSFGRALDRAGFSQELLERAAAAVVFSLDEQALASTFGRRGFRLGLLATGMLGEVVYLAAGEVGLRACGVGAFADEELSGLLGLSEGTSPVYLVALGAE